MITDLLGRACRLHDKLTNAKSCSEIIDIIHSEIHAVFNMSTTSLYIHKSNPPYDYLYIDDYRSKNDLSDMVGESGVNVFKVNGDPWLEHLLQAESVLYVEDPSVNSMMKKEVVESIKLTGIMLKKITLSTGQIVIISATSHSLEVPNINEVNINYFDLMCKFIQSNLDRVDDKVRKEFHQNAINSLFSAMRRLDEAHNFIEKTHKDSRLYKQCSEIIERTRIYTKNFMEAERASSQFTPDKTRRMIYMLGDTNTTESLNLILSSQNIECSLIKKGADVSNSTILVDLDPFVNDLVSLEDSIESLYNSNYIIALVPHYSEKILKMFGDKVQWTIPQPLICVDFASIMTERPQISFPGLNCHKNNCYI